MESRAPTRMMTINPKVDLTLPMTTMATIPIASLALRLAPVLDRRQMMNLTTMTLQPVAIRRTRPSQVWVQ